MQMSRSTTTASWAIAWGIFADVQGANQVIKPLHKELVDFSNHINQLRRIKVALHHMNDILHQQIALYAHDRRRSRSHKKHQEIVTRLTVWIFFLIKLSVVEGHLNGCTI